MAPGSVELPMMPALCTDTISTFSTGAQSMPEQHSIGYQSWAAAAVAINSRPANIHALAITCLAGFAPLSSSSDSRPSLADARPAIAVPRFVVGSLPRSLVSTDLSHRHGLRRTVRRVVQMDVLQVPCPAPPSRFEDGLMTRILQRFGGNVLARLCLFGRRRGMVVQSPGS